MEPESPPTPAKPLRRALTTSAIVGSAVSLGHVLAPGAWWWVLIHFLLPLTVFSLSAWLSGQRRLSRGLVFRGVATVLVVGVSFTAINTTFTLPPVIRVVLNYLVPFVVSMLGSMRRG